LNSYEYKVKRIGYLFIVLSVFIIFIGAILREHSPQFDNYLSESSKNITLEPGIGLIIGNSSIFITIIWVLGLGGLFIWERFFFWFQYKVRGLFLFLGYRLYSFFGSLCFFNEIFNIGFNKYL